MTHRQAVPVVKPPVTWILVADGRQAQLYTRQKVEKMIPLAGNSRRGHFAETTSHEPVPIPGMKWEAESPDQYEVGRNATGMVFESSGGARHMSEPHMDVREEIKIHFARAIAEQLNQALSKKAFDRLVLIAPARMLGEIKKHLDKKVIKQITAEMPKDLTHCNGPALAEHLESIA